MLIEGLSISRPEVKASPTSKHQLEPVSESCVFAGGQGVRMQGQRGGGREGTGPTVSAWV